MVFVVYCWFVLSFRIGLELRIGCMMGLCLVV